MSITSATPSATATGGLWQNFVATAADPGALVARLALGIVMFPHGAQKALGWFGGYGFKATLGFFTQGMHIPLPLALLAIAAEFLGSLGLITGLLGRVAAFGILVNMLVAIATVHLHNGFFMNWAGTQHGEGFEYHLLAIGLALVVLFKGSGALSLDRLFTKDAR
ncbi:MAG TPA: DoxX family protein [Oscillatoriaceae cyanobacterium]